MPHRHIDGHHPGTLAPSRSATSEHDERGRPQAGPDRHDLGVVHLQGLRLGPARGAAAQQGHGTRLVLFRPRDAGLAPSAP